MISLPRWQRDVINSYNTINFSGLVQNDVILPLIEERSPDIFKKYAPKKVEFSFDKKRVMV